jgi:hypothetical protein
LAPDGASRHNPAIVRRRPDMPYTVSIDDTHRLVEIIYSGQITIGTRMDAMNEGVALLEARQYSRVLVDLRGSVAALEPLDAGNAFATRLAYWPRLRDSRLAFVTLPSQYSNLLVENMAAARHLSLQHFHRREDALQWLLLDR